MAKCYICWKETDKVYRPDIDMTGIPICDTKDDVCALELYKELWIFDDFNSEYNTYERKPNSKWDR